MTSIKSMTKAQLIAKIEEMSGAVPMIVCDTCGESTVRKSLNQKRCPSCREAKETASAEAWVAKKADPEKAAKRAARKQWNDAKGTDVLRGAWGIPQGTSLNVALETGLLVMDAEGNLDVPTAKATKAAKAPKAKTPARVSPDTKKVTALVEAGFTREQAEALVASKS